MTDTPLRRQAAFLVLILAVALALRLYRINTPFLEAYWIRDLMVNAVAQNFHEKGVNLLWPEIDYSPDQPNYIDIELQLPAALAAGAWRLFGVHTWVPRAFSILWSLLGILAFYALCRRFLSLEGAQAATLVLALSPVNVFMGRSFMPEPLTLCCSLVCVLFFVRWATEGRTADIIIAGVAGATAALTKPPIIHIGLLLVWFLWQQRRMEGPDGGHERLEGPDGGMEGPDGGMEGPDTSRDATRRARSPAPPEGGRSPSFRDWRLYLFAAMVLVPLALHMNHSRHIGEQYWSVGTGFASGMWFSPSYLTNPITLAVLLARFTLEILTPLGLVGLLVGLPLINRKLADGSENRALFFGVWLIAAAIYFFALLGGNVRQTYYQLWLLPPCAGIIGYAWQLLREHLPGSRRLIGLFVPAVVILSIWGAHPYYELRTPILEAAEALDEVDPQRSWIITYPAGFNCHYYLNRRGWCGRDVDRDYRWVAPGNPEYIEQRMTRGAKFCVVFTQDPKAPRDFVIEAYLARNHELVREGEGFLIYRLRPR